jgi:hypothetical protein
MKKVVETIKAQEIKSSSELSAIREEMSALKAEIQDSTTSEWKMRKAIAALKNDARIEAGLPPRKDKAGLKKFLARRFSRGGGGSQKSRASMSYKSSFDDSLFDDEGSLMTRHSAPDCMPILPPSVSHQERDDDKLDDSSNEGQVDVDATVEADKIESAISKNSSLKEAGSFPLTQTLSKSSVQDNGEVELEVPSTTNPPTISVL